MTSFRHLPGALAFGLAAAAGLGTPVAAAERPREDRLLIVFAPDIRSEPLARQRDMAAQARDGFGDRELKLIEVVGDKVTGSAESAAQLRRRYGVPGGSFRALLIGKDGGTKMTESAPIPAEQLFATIDAMPMRRDEMKEPPRR